MTWMVMSILSIIVFIPYPSTPRWLELLVLLFIFIIIKL